MNHTVTRFEEEKNERRVTYCMCCQYWIIFDMDMDFDTTVQRFKCILNCFGLSQFGTQVNVSPKWTTRFFAVAYLLVVVSMYVFAIYYRYFYSDPTEVVFSVISYMYISCDLVMQFTVVGQALYFYKSSNRLRCLYNFMQKYMQTRLGYSTRFNHFQKRMCWLTLLVMVPHLALIVLRTMFFRLQLGTVFGVIFMIFHSLASLVKLQLIFHVELFNYFLKLISQWLQSRTSEFTTTGLYQRNLILKMQQMRGYNDILHMKLLHFKLWEISMIINRIYGWSLAVSVVRNFIEMSFGAYWFYLFYNKANMQFFNLLRMWKKMSFVGIWRNSSNHK